MGAVGEATLPGLVFATWGRRDARDWQAGVLSVLLVVQLAWLDFGATAAQAAVTLTAALGTQALASRLAVRPFDWRSPLITGLSLCLLLRSHEPAMWAAAGLAGVGSKYLIRVRGRHVFNPACFAIVLAVLTGQAWVSPGQWGALAWSALLVGGGAALVLGRARRADTAAAFLCSYAGLLALRCALLGDPWTIPLHQLQSGALLIFGLFMITDPRTTPLHRTGRLAFATCVAGLAYGLQFHWQMREGLFYALALLAPAVPLIDRLAPALALVKETPSCASPASPASPAPGWSAPVPLPGPSAASTSPARTSR